MIKKILVRTQSYVKKEQAWNIMFNFSLLNYAPMQSGHINLVDEIFAIFEKAMNSND